MATLELSASEIVRSRPQVIGGLLTPIAGNRVACQLYQGPVKDGWVLSAHDGGTDPRRNFRDWRFRSAARDIECNYFEQWRLLNRDVARLLSAYFHVFLIDRATRREQKVLAIHTDPYDGSRDDIRRSCKQSVHLHMLAATQPFPGCHFPLLLSHMDDHLDRCLESVDNLTAILRRVMLILRHEVIDLFQQ